MHSAVYYPHTVISNLGILKTSLLLWDTIEYIVPWSDFELRYSNPQFREAVDMVATEHVPTADEQTAAHDLIEDMATRPLPTSFTYGSSTGPSDPYVMYHEKLMPETWRMLQDLQLAGQQPAHIPVSEHMGLSMMSILADCCAGHSKRRMTDRSESYTVMTSLFTEEDHSAMDGQQLYDRVVPVTLRTLNLDNVDLKKLIDFRKRERAESGYHIRDLRHRYVDKLEAFVNDLVSKDLTQRDKVEFERVFVEEMKDDVAHLRYELRSEANQALFTKEMLVAALAGAATAAGAFCSVSTAIPHELLTGGATVTIGGLLGVKSKFAAARRAVLRKHSMAYLHELSGGFGL